MQISTKELARVTVVTITGRVDHETYHQLKQVLDELLSARKHNIIVDLSATEYINSAGLKALYSAHRETQSKHQGDVRLVAPSKQVSETLHLVGFDRVFRIYPELVEAVGSF